MVKFDNPFIVFVILFPGILCNALLLVLLHFLGISPQSLLNSEVMTLGFGSVFSLLMGIFLLFLSQKNKLARPYRLHFFKTKNLNLALESLTMPLVEIEKKIKKDFDKTVSLENANNRLFIKEIFDDIYYSLDRKIGIPRIMSLRLLIEFLPVCITGIGCILFLTFTSGIYLYKTQGIPPFFLLFIIFQLISLYIAYKGLRYLENRFYRACLNVYTSKQYRNLNFKTTN